MLDFTDRLLVKPCGRMSESKASSHEWNFVDSSDRQEGRAVMLTRTTDRQRVGGSRRGAVALRRIGHNDRKFLQARHFRGHSITWRALPGAFGKPNSIWKRFWRFDRSGVFEAFVELLAETSTFAHVAQMLDCIALTYPPPVPRAGRISRPSADRGVAVNAGDKIPH